MVMRSYTPNDKTLLSNYFDPYNKTHIKAWAQLRRTGVWPKWFVSQLDGKGINIDQWWENSLRTRMAEAWVQHVMTDPESEEESDE